MDICKYKKYTVKDATIICIDCNKYPFASEMVRRGYAYYSTDQKVAIGYEIVNNTVPYKVFLPFFLYHREICLRKVRHHIRTFVKFDIAIIRMKMYIKEIDDISKQILIHCCSRWKELPMVILNLIGQYCYDNFHSQGVYKNWLFHRAYIDFTMK